MILKLQERYINMAMRSSKDWKTVLNNKLKQIKSSILVIKYSDNIVLLSNGVSLERKPKNNEVDFLKRVLMAETKHGNMTQRQIFFDEIFSGDLKIRNAALEKAKKLEKTSAAKQLINLGYKPSDNLKRYYAKNPGKRAEFSTGKTPWNKGKNKKTDKRILEISKRMKGANNPSIRFPMSEERRKNHSKLMKTMIMEGKFTPNTNNRFTHYDVVWEGKRYRSSWEVLFHILNPKFQYEKKRIEYFDENGISRIFIVDFISEEDKKLVEIKPDSVVKRNIRTQHKIKGAEDWCRKNGFVFELWNEFTFREKIEYKDIPFEDIPKNLHKKIEYVYTRKTI